jgi:two-component system, response regulator, stage 0 sporulation protein A
MNSAIIEMLRRVGIPAHVKGYEYLKKAIALCREDKSYLEAVTKELYPTIAKEFGTTGSRVERAIRHAIELGYNRGDHETLTHIFGYTISAQRGKPTNSEFIATLTEQLILEHGEVSTSKGH